MAKPCSVSTAPSLGLRSRTWPYDASTLKSVPRYLLMVLALAGDSTMSRFFAMRQVSGTQEEKARQATGTYVYIVGSHGRACCQVRARRMVGDILRHTSVGAHVAATGSRGDATIQLQRH